ncbi:MAG TPA: heavy metal-responsive transcriptional regulator [Vicinamibacterales bacterium]|nr:heavy metal-responsive transcriptional regulator [Vicinamibacterales bacterium]
MDRWLTIGAVAAATGESRDTIRYYERIGLVPRAARTDAGYRQYRDGIIRRLGLIRNAQRFGFSLKEIAGFLGVRDGGGKPCHDVRAAAGRLIMAIDRQIAELVATRKQMRKTLKTWDRTLAATPPDRPAYLLERMTTPETTTRKRFSNRKQ